MAEGRSNNFNGQNPKDKVWFDDEEFVIRKRIPPFLPKKPTDFYVTKKTSFKIQLERCRNLIEKGEEEIHVHSIGSGIPLALNFALQVQKENSKSVKLETVTSTFVLTDDFEEEVNSQQHPKNNTGIHIRLKISQDPPTKTISEH